MGGRHDRRVAELAGLEQAGAAGVAS
jgi:hypothetical protein